MSDLRLRARYLRAGTHHVEDLTLPVATTALLLVDVYFDDQENGSWGDPAHPLTQHLTQMEEAIAAALAATRQVPIPVLYAMNSAPRIALARSAFGEHFARTWAGDSSPEAFDRAFAEGGVDPREYHAGRDAPLKVPARLAPQPGDYYIRKHAYSAFFDTRLDTALRNLRIETLICAGLWANVCLAATALDALYRNYRVFWLRDGTVAGESDADCASLANTGRWVAWFEEIVGFTISSEELVAACTAATRRRRQMEDRNES